MAKLLGLLMEIEQKIIAEALLATGKTPKEVTELTELGYGTVLQLRKALPTQEDKVVQELAAIPTERLEAIAEAEPELDETVEGVKGLQKLSSKFQDVLTRSVERAEVFLDADDLKPSEWVAINNSLSNAYNNIFNNRGVNVNVNSNNQFSSTKLSMFKGSMRE